MPTRLPNRRRKPRVSAETRANIVATVAECGFALAFVGTAVFLMTHIAMVEPGLDPVQTMRSMLGP